MSHVYLKVPRLGVDWVPQNSRSTGGTEFMAKRARPKLVLLQCSFAFGDGDAAGAGGKPSVAFLEADTAVAFVDCGELGEFGGEFEGTAVAVAVVGLELWSWSGTWLRHRGGWKVRGCCWL